jgi:hypothetical protein
MNVAQSEHLKAMACKMEAHAEAIKQRMQALQRNNLFSMPIDLIPANFEDTFYYAEAIQKVYADMMPRMDELARSTEIAWWIYYEKAGPSEQERYIGALDADTMEQARLRASERYEIPAHELKVIPATPQAGV